MYARVRGVVSMLDLMTIWENEDVSDVDLRLLFWKLGP